MTLACIPYGRDVRRTIISHNQIPREVVDLPGPEKKEIVAYTEEELYGMLLIEDETFKDEGREIYFEEIVRKMREHLGDDSD